MELDGETVSNLNSVYSKSHNSARQHVLGELLELGADSNLVIPLHRPALTASPNQRVDTAALGLEVESVPSLGINPSHALQHPGFYYYMAARSTEIRREKFLAALATEVGHHVLFATECDLNVRPRNNHRNL